MNIILVNLSFIFCNKQYEPQKADENILGKRPLGGWYKITIL